MSAIRKQYNMRKFLLILPFLCAGIVLQAQTHLDSLRTIWEDVEQPDSSRAFSLMSIITKKYLFTNPDSSRILANHLLNFGREKGYPRAEAMGYDAIAISWFLVGEYPKSLDYFNRSLALFRALGDEKSEANTLGNIGNIYSAQGLDSKALDLYLRNLKTHERLGDKRLAAVTLGNIGVIYENMDDLDRAFDYYERSLAMGSLIDQKRIIANSMGNMGNIHLERGEYQKALDAYVKSISLNKKIDNIPAVINTLGNISSVYTKMSEFEKALSYLEESVEASLKLGDKRGLSRSYIKIGTVFQLENKQQKAIKYCLDAYRLAQEIGALVQQKEACECLYTNFKKTRQTDIALEYFEKFKIIEDSLSSEDLAKKIQQIEFAELMLNDSIAKAQEARLVREAHQAEVRQKNQTRNMLVGVGLLLIILAGGIYNRLRFTRKSRAIIQAEKDRSENLLLNILPVDIAEELKENGRADAREYDNVSILFADIKGFTAASEKLTAHDLVAEINTCFGAFDGIMLKYKIEKIKTIGDAYMAAGGLPVPSNDSVKNTVSAALEMQVFITQRKEEMDAEGKSAYEMRLGIHTGPVVAGIVGVIKFQYDIWGDTVNTASRVESSGEVGKVNVSQATYEMLKDDPEFVFEKRGKIKAKGKGEIEMYFVSKA